MGIRAIETQDLPVLFDLRASTRKHPFSRAALEQLGITEESTAALLRTTHRGWLWEADGQIAGFAMGDGSTGEVTVIAVGPEFEGQGVGARLLTAVESWLASQGWAEFWLWSSSNTETRAYGFYGRQGWIVAEVKAEIAYFKKRPGPPPLPLGASRPEAVTFGLRRAGPGDAEAACAALRRSITECCSADHRHDPAILSAWLANKTPETVRSWFSSPAHGIVALQSGAIVGVGMLNGSNLITLNYLVPETRFQGIGSALLRALEAEALKRGGTELELYSTVTAHAFYERNGYRDTGKVSPMFGLSSRAMSKSLAPAIPPGQSRATLT